LPGLNGSGAAAAVPPPIDKNKDKYDQQQHKNLNSHARKLTTHVHTKPNETKAWFRGFLCHWTRKRTGPTLQLPRPAWGNITINDNKTLDCGTENKSKNKKTKRKLQIPHVSS